MSKDSCHELLACMIQTSMIDKQIEQTLKDLLLDLNSHISRNKSCDENF
jgi:hypothetical protein